jgi:hypothetical protein
MKLFLDTNLPILLFLIFMTLKLCGVITWSWWIVTLPLWIVLLTVVVVFLIIVMDR